MANAIIQKDTGVVSEVFAEFFRKLRCQPCMDDLLVQALEKASEEGKLKELKTVHCLLSAANQWHREAA
jgi:hypothetical protein